MTGEFYAEMLTLTRERRGWTKEELATRCGVSRRTVTKWESGLVIAPPVELIGLVLDVPPNLFMQQPPPAIHAESLSFRALSTLGARQTRSAVATARMGVSFSRWIDARFHAPEVDVPDTDTLTAPKRNDDTSPAELAVLLRAEWGLAARPVRNMISTLERHGIRVFSIGSEDRVVDAFSFWHSERGYVFLNLDKSAERTRFDLAHELGHLVMHRGTSTSRSRTYEYEANEFASSFLMPADGLMAHAATAGRDLRLADVTQLKSSWKVSAVAMVRRLHDLQLISDWSYRNWMIHLSSKGYRRAEPGGINPEQSKILGKVLQGRRSQSAFERMAIECGIPPEDLRSLVHGLTLLQLPTRDKALGDSLANRELGSSVAGELTLISDSHA